MKVFKDISTQLKKDKVQRVFYGIALIIWIAIWIDDFDLFNSDSAFGIKYFWIMIIPMLNLIGQILFNTTILWWVSATLIFSYTILTIYHIIGDILICNLIIECVKDFSWDLKEVVIMMFVLIILFLVNWVTWQLKPVSAETR